MPVFRAHVRSSDSIDYERTATLKDLEELLTAEDSRGQRAVFSPVCGPPHTSAFSSDMDREATVASTRQSRSSSRVSQKASTSEKMVVFRDNAVTARTDEPPSKTTSHVVSIDPDYFEDILAISDQGSHEISRRPKVEEKSLEPVPRNENDNDAATEGATDAANTIQLARQLDNIALRRKLLLQQLDDLQREESRVLVLLTKAISEAPHVPNLQPALQSPSIRPLNASLLPIPATSPFRLPRKQPSKSLRNPTPLRPVSAPTISTLSSAGRRAASSFKSVTLGEKTERAIVEISATLRVVELSPPNHDRARSSNLSTSRVPVDFGDKPDSRPRATKSPSRPLVGSTRRKSNSRGRIKGKSEDAPRTAGLQPPFPLSVQPSLIDDGGSKGGSGSRYADPPPTKNMPGRPPHVEGDRVKSKAGGLPAPSVRSARSGSRGRNRSKDPNIHHSHGLRAPMYRLMPQHAVQKPDTEKGWEF